MPKTNFPVGLAASFVLGLGTGGCAFLMPGANKSQAPANPPAAVALPATSQQRSVAALANEAAGPGGGWIIAASPEMLRTHSLGSARKVNQQAEQQPVRHTDAENSPNADLNHDGFVTMDEILALKRAGLTSNDIIDHVRQTPMTFELSDRQQQYLKDRAIDQSVINAMLQMNGNGPNSNPDAAPR